MAPLCPGSVSEGDRGLGGAGRNGPLDRRAGTGGGRTRGLLRAQYVRRRIDTIRTLCAGVGPESRARQPRPSFDWRGRLERRNERCRPGGARRKRVAGLVSTCELERALRDRRPAGAGDEERARQAIRSVATRSVRHEDRMLLLLSPPFDETSPDPGYIQGYPPGIRENGGQSHTPRPGSTARAWSRSWDSESAAPPSIWYCQLDEWRVQLKQGVGRDCSGSSGGTPFFEGAGT